MEVNAVNLVIIVSIVVAGNSNANSKYGVIVYIYKYNKYFVTRRPPGSPFGET